MSRTPPIYHLDYSRYAAQQPVQQKPPERRYEVINRLGRGSFSEVFLAKNQNTGQFIAMKVFDKSKVTPEQTELIKREVDIMGRFDHPNIVKLLDILETPSNFFIAMELVEGGELFDHIVSRGFYSEGQAIDIIKQLCEVVSFMHSHGVAHRDLKPQNLLCTKNGKVKVADFGLSKIFLNEEMKTACGTPDYIAPEVLCCKPPYSQKIDVWAIGVIAYVLLCGYTPFVADTYKDLYEQITLAPIVFPKAEWEHISSEAKDFILKTCNKDPSSRLSAAECLKHSWLQDKFLQEKLTKELPQLKHFQDSLYDYNQRRKSHLNLANNEEDFDDEKIIKNGLSPLDN